MSNSYFLVETVYCEEEDDQSTIEHGKHKLHVVQRVECHHDQHNTQQEEECGCYGDTQSYSVQGERK